MLGFLGISARLPATLTAGYLSPALPEDTWETGQKKRRALAQDKQRPRVPPAARCCAIPTKARAGTGAEHSEPAARTRHLRPSFDDNLMVFPASVHKALLSVSEHGEPAISPWDGSISPVDGDNKNPF